MFFFHGNLNSCLFQAAWGKTESVSHASGARVIALDRPGYGDSTFIENRQYSMVTSEIDQLANHLEIPKFSVLGYSSGGPYAMACAANLSTRVSSCGLISSDGPYFDMGMDAVSRMFGTDNVTGDFNMTRIQKEFAELEASYVSMSKEDRKEMALIDIRHAAKQGVDKGPWQDGMLESSPWDFDIGLVGESGCPVLLWHGSDDDVVSPEVARYLLSRCPSVSSTFIEGESHSLIRRHWGQILTDLVATAAV